MEPQKDASSSMDDSGDDEEKMDLMEFIRSIDREKREMNGSNRSSPDSQFSTAFEPSSGGTPKLSDTKKSGSVEERRKLSVDNLSCSTPPRKLIPSLRMKAYKGRRQETFHSLDAYVAKNDDTSADSEEVTSISEDVLKMPAIEALRVSSPSNAGGFGPSNLRKNYQKIMSDPSLVSNRKSASCTRESTGSRNSSASKKPNLVLHTIPQPDGGVIGFLAESKETEEEEGGGNAAATESQQLETNKNAKK